MINYNTSEISRWAREIKAGQLITLSGLVYTARDAAHKRLAELIGRDEELPFELKGSFIYYAGPTPARPGAPSGACGPTTSGRMDQYAPELIRRGLACMIGKGDRSAEVISAMREHGVPYLAALGGAGALAARHIRSVREVAFPELGCESVKLLEFDRFPLVAAIDCAGGNVYKRDAGV